MGRIKIGKGKEGREEGGKGSREGVAASGVKGGNSIEEISGRIESKVGGGIDW